jgi:hypothetical protein
MDWFWNCPGYARCHVAIPSCIKDPLKSWFSTGYTGSFGFQKQWFLRICIYDWGDGPAKTIEKKTQCNPQLDQLVIFWYFFWFGIPAINHKPKRWGLFNGFNPSLPLNPRRSTCTLKRHAGSSGSQLSSIEWIKVEIIVIGSVKLYVHYSYMCELCVHRYQVSKHIFSNYCIMNFDEFWIFIINSY